jgi:[protein-PII] uridylyltransferase
MPRKESLRLNFELMNETFADAGALREKFSPILQAYLVSERARAEEALLKTGNGLQCARTLSGLMDTVVNAIYDTIILKLFIDDTKAAINAVSIVATGGYGRSTLAPGSDIDLLFVLSDDNRELGEAITEGVLYILWDLKLKVGQAVRQIDECLRDSVSDYTARTALLEARWLAGNATLFEQLKQRFHDEVVKLSPREFVEAKLHERDQRIGKAGESRYLLEPNVKDGKGGLRDLQSLVWIFRYLAIAQQASFEHVRDELVNSREVKLFARCEDFLWRVRCHMHFLSGRAEERLVFDLQRGVAQRLGYADRKSQSAVERFMQSYYLVAKDVGMLTAYLCTELEARHVKDEPSLDRGAGFHGKAQPKRAFLNDPYFIRENGRLTLKRPDAFSAYPLNIIRMFWLADRYYIPMHPEALYEARQARHLIDRALRANPDANQFFMDILTSRTSPELVLRAMNDSGVLSQFIPEFRRIVGMMQFNMYHAYTVDEHSLYAVAALTAIENGSTPEVDTIALTLSEESRRVLYFTTLIHDIAKGRPEDHCVAGAEIARKLAPRFGFSDDETDTVAWLIEHHLVMSNIAQRRDLSDPATIRVFAETVQSQERLKLLYLLTIADIKAVGPGIWTPWKGQLLFALYSETAVILGGGSSESLHARKYHAQQALRRLLPGWTEDQWERYIGYHTATYWARGDLIRQKEHADLIFGIEESGRPFGAKARIDSAAGVTDITVYAPDRPGLLAITAGACAASDANIVGAQVFTTLHGYGLTTVTLAQSFERMEDEERRAARIIATFEKALTGEVTIASLIQEKKLRKARSRTFKVPIRVRINNDQATDHTILEVAGLDRPGLLYELTKVISEFNISITSAHISTIGEKVVDTFYIQTEMRKKLEDEHVSLLLRQTLTSVLSA